MCHRCHRGCSQRSPEVTPKSPWRSGLKHALAVSWEHGLSRPVHEELRLVQLLPVAILKFLILFQHGALHVRVARFPAKAVAWFCASEGESAKLDSKPTRLGRTVPSFTQGLSCGLEEENKTQTERLSSPAFPTTGFQPRGG